LSNELEVLKVAENALRAGDTKGALAALDRYDTVLKGRRLRAEASVLRIETLSRAGQTQAASALARRFVADNPTSPLVDRARAFIESEKEQ
jgi:outer membrane protein assembly factor BamD (BamD/ComL family)